jgi:hypothetical protein
METATLLLLVLAVVLAGVTLHAWRIGNERRDVTLLGSFAAVFAAAAVATSIL